ncbi:cation transporter [Thiohalorhabdus denitrificans]|uniref:Cation:H+ antiporter n=1 Tax=Thiohalorhabdus denitrificans TaxID=381306 RepID=A0A0P9CV21_9GAMM|nr:sodium:calcium antiporter [Thiohalorhabdus denitrificans]KPV40514.1 cation transporter [Thiohalorhabdus denitrificans]SCY61511.1 cation:H+ antiporter [Thiohalorhabdus denitrificans]
MGSQVWPLGLSLAVFGLATLVIAVVGVRLASLADRLADRTGLGEAFVGAVFLGASTSLPGIIASVTAAANGYPSLAMSNALGGIAVQTAFLAVADLAYRRANLEHAAASLPNMMWGILLVILLGGLLVAVLGPEASILGVHPVSPVLLVAYGYGAHLVAESREEPMWHPRQTAATRTDQPNAENLERGSLVGLWAAFLAAALVVSVAGWGVTRAGESLSELTGISQSVVGALMVAVATSLPELVTSVAAVRRGALTLAVGGVLGGNAFDTLFAAVADMAYREGSIYHAMGPREPALAALTVLMAGVLVLGLLRRERQGPGRIGFESVVVLSLYLLGALILGAGA